MGFDRNSVSIDDPNKGPPQANVRRSADFSTMTGAVRDRFVADLDASGHLDAVDIEPLAARLIQAD